MSVKKISGTKKKKMPGPVKVLCIFAAVLLLIAFFLWYGCHGLHVSKKMVSSGKISSPVKILQLSDLHGASFGKDNRLLISLVKKQNPDLIFVTGDMYTWSRDEEMERQRESALSLLSELASSYEVYYINGEHDNSEKFFADLEAAGVKLTRDRRTDITVNGNEISLFGIGDVYFSPTYTMEGRYTLDESRYNILLAHIDESEIYTELPFDIIFCGDNHGGIVRIPGLGPAYCSGTFFPKLKGVPYRDRGLFEVGGSLLYISGGLGNYPVDFRLFNVPDVPVITLE